MQLYYAIGGGLGHLARASAFFYTHKHLHLKECILLTASDYVGIDFLPNFHKIVHVPSGFQRDLVAYTTFLKELIEKNCIEKIYLDAFPVGILGEWLDFFLDSTLDFFYVARLLNWGNYAPLLASKDIRFKETFITEKLLAIHQEFVDKHSQKTSLISLQYPDTAPSESVKYALKRSKKQGKSIWLIIHSTPEKEVLALVEYAQATARLRKQSPFFYLISQVKPKNLPSCILQIDAQPCRALFEQAELIFSACGFNLMQQLLPYRNKHLFLPFERKYDLQFERAKHRR